MKAKRLTQPTKVGATFVGLVLGSKLLAKYMHLEAAHLQYQCV